MAPFLSDPSAENKRVLFLFARTRVASSSAMVVLCKRIIDLLFGRVVSFSLLNGHDPKIALIF